MRRFHFEANIMFDAVDVADALNKLSVHFAHKAHAEHWEDTLEQTGSMDLHPVENCNMLVENMVREEFSDKVTEVMKDPAFREIED